MRCCLGCAATSDDAGWSRNPCCLALCQFTRVHPMGWSRTSNLLAIDNRHWYIYIYICVHHHYHGSSDWSKTESLFLYHLILSYDNVIDKNKCCLLSPDLHLLPIIDIWPWSDPIEISKHSTGQSAWVGLSVEDSPENNSISVRFWFESIQVIWDWTSWIEHSYDNVKIKTANITQDWLSVSTAQKLLNQFVWIRSNGKSYLNDDEIHNKYK